MKLLFLRESELVKCGHCSIVPVKPDPSDSDRKVVLHMFIVVKGSGLKRCSGCNATELALA